MMQYWNRYCNIANLYTDSIVMVASNCGITAPTSAAVATSSPATASSTEVVASQAAGCSSSSGDGSAEQQPELKRARTSVFASYKKRQQAKTVPTAPTTVKQLIDEYLLFAPGDDEHTRGWDEIRKFRYYDNMQPLFEYTFCSPATSAPVERAFSQGGLFMRPHRACLGDRTLCDLMYSKCNKSFK